MPDICMCSPTRIEKKCLKCHRFNAEPDYHQSYSNFYEDCLANKYINYIPPRKFDKLIERESKA